MHIKITLALIAVILIGCTSDNEHFCARYEYVYDQLKDPTLPSYNEMKQQLQKEMEQKPGDSEKSKFMLFVLEDYHVEIKPERLSAQAFCLQSSRWNYY